VRREWILLEQARERLNAATGWREAGFIDHAGLTEVRSVRPGLRLPIGWIWRLLVFFFSLAGLGGALGTVLLLLGEIFDGSGGAGAVFLLFAGGCLVLAELVSAQDGPGLIGADAAGSLMALGCGAIGVGLLLHGVGIDDDLVLHVMPLVAATLLALAAWRYGYWPYAAGATACLFLQMTLLDQGRLLWILAGASMAAGAWRYRDSPGSPSHRACLRAALGISLGALYAAVNLYSVEALRFGDFLDLRPGPLPGALPVRLAAGLATFLVPAAVLAWGVAARNRLLLSLGILFAALSLVTLRAYVHVAPLEFVLIASGAALVAGSLALIRFLAGGPGGERHGFTGAPLFDDERREHLLAAAAVVIATPAARRLPDQGAFGGQGGDFGGGGASSAF
jgi:hypothetical protein